MTASTLSTARRENGRRRPRGYADWRPHRSTRVLLGQVEQVLGEYRDHLPLTVRQIFYRLVGAFDFPKDENAYARLGEHLVRARRARLIPFDAIRDDGVVTFATRWHDDVDGFWDDVGRQAHAYRRDRQAGQPVRVELWCEAAGMLPQLAAIADRYSVPVYSAGGFASVTANRSIAERAIARTTPTVLLHVGDFDPSGASIFEAMAADAAAFVEADRIIGTLRIEARRIALTAEQVATYELPTAPAKATDTRSRTWQGETCQLEALPPDVLGELVEDAIRAELRLDLIDRQLEAEDRDRAELLRALPEVAAS